MSSRNQRKNSVPERLFAQTESLGISQEMARRDHTHGTPDRPETDYIRATTGEKLAASISSQPDGSYGIDWEVIA